ncbi:MAG: META domain-containing protein [Rubellimicrobium sp.]|nr:META domain-containing protein [Rubellimicrobium sp.]
MTLRSLATLALIALASAAYAEESRFNCGSTEVNVLYIGEDLVMSAPGALFLLHPAVAASGAKYERSGDPGTYFWSRGTTAMVSILGEELSECIEIPPSGEWQVTGLNGEDVPAGIEMTMEFSLFGTVSGIAACNRYNGGWEVQDGELIFGAVAMTRMACEPDLMELEQQFSLALERIEGFSRDDAGQLVLSGPGGLPAVVADRRSR